MEVVTGKRIRDIFLDNGNWWKLFIKKHHLMRPAIIKNVLKMLACRTTLLGFKLYICVTCNISKKVPHSCKSKFCSSCGKKATDKWINNAFETLPDTTWQHITFTMPSDFWDLFWLNRKLLNEIPPLAANIIKDLCAKEGFIPGIYLAIHTFGRDLKNNVHIHLSTTVGGLDLNTKSTWVKSIYFHHKILKAQWKYQIINLFRSKFKCDNIKHNVEYLGKYLKRPPIGETRIKDYDGKSVTYEFLDHYTKKTETMTLPVLDFIGRLISHIADPNFRNIRYYGFLANAIKGKFLPLVNKLVRKNKTLLKKTKTLWREMIIDSFGHDPLACKQCGNFMKLEYERYGSLIPLNSLHWNLANGHYQIL